jgi:hypothetical protein
MGRGAMRSKALLLAVVTQLVFGCFSSKITRRDAANAASLHSLRTRSAAEGAVAEDESVWEQRWHLVLH